MNEKRLKAMLKYLPCKAGAIPLNLRSLGSAEAEGLASYDASKGHLWTLTPKGEAFMGGSLKVSKARRFA